MCCCRSTPTAPGFVVCTDWQATTEPASNANSNRKVAARMAIILTNLYASRVPQQLEKFPAPVLPAHAVAERPRVSPRREEAQVLEPRAGRRAAAVHAQQHRVPGEPAIEGKLRLVPDLAGNGALGFRRAEARGMHPLRLRERQVDRVEALDEAGIRTGPLRLAPH